MNSEKLLQLEKVHLFSRQRKILYLVLENRLWEAYAKIAIFIFTFFFISFPTSQK